ncbi:hypothetical protein FHS87_003823 [Roseomonas pecuniae]|uniref:Uncharacterized protein n=1 Tax=Muricoccus pecuniae TaxID=693023 RepID=A0A840YH48_9PROT|nr:hypothetical protein [Roseomonas pecuniae]
MNVLRLGLHPDGLAPRILNFPQWRAHLLARLAHDAQASADAVLVDLLEELRTLPMPAQSRGTRSAVPEHAGIAFRCGSQRPTDRSASSARRRCSAPP